jgi:hypothetical protein
MDSSPEIQAKRLQKVLRLYIMRHLMDKEWACYVTPDEIINTYPAVQAQVEYMVSILGTIVSWRTNLVRFRFGEGGKGPKYDDLVKNTHEFVDKNTALYREGALKLTPTKLGVSSPNRDWRAEMQRRCWTGPQDDFGLIWKVSGEKGKYFEKLHDKVMAIVGLEKKQLPVEDYTACFPSREELRTMLDENPAQFREWEKKMPELQEKEADRRRRLIDLGEIPGEIKGYVVKLLAFDYLNQGYLYRDLVNLLEREGGVW